METGHHRHSLYPVRNKWVNTVYPLLCSCPNGSLIVNFFFLLFLHLIKRVLAKGQQKYVKKESRLLPDPVKRTQRERERERERVSLTTISTRRLYYIIQIL